MDGDESRTSENSRKKKMLQRCSSLTNWGRDEKATTTTERRIFACTSKRSRTPFIVAGKGGKKAVRVGITKTP